jgi:hypothetical protein
MKGAEENLEAKRNELTGGLIKLHNEMLHKMYSLPTKIRSLK